MYWCGHVVNANWPFSPSSEYTTKNDDDEKEEKFARINMMIEASQLANGQIEFCCFNLWFDAKWQKQKRSQFGYCGYDDDNNNSNNRMDALCIYVVELVAELSGDLATCTGTIKCSRQAPYEHFKHFKHFESFKRNAL